MSLAIDILGWIAAIILLFAYYLVSTHRTSGSSFRYQSMNIIGSIGLLINTCYYGAYPSTFVNIVWIGIAFYALSAYNQNK